MIALTLYTTDGCHLCDEAMRVLQAFLLERPDFFQIHKIDIVESEQLVETYGERIPVIAVQGKTNDLGWPFDLALLSQYLDNND